MPSWTSKNLEERVAKMAEYKDPELTSSHENTKITLIAGTIIYEKDWNLPKKTFYRRSHKMGRKADLWYNQITFPPSRWPTKWRIIILHRFYHRHESWVPCRLPSLGVQHQEDEPGERLALKASRFNCTSPTGLGKILERWIQKTMRTGIQDKNSNLTKPGSDLLNDLRVSSRDSKRLQLTLGT